MDERIHARFFSTMIFKGKRVAFDCKRHVRRVTVDMLDRTRCLLLGTGTLQQEFDATLAAFRWVVQQRSRSQRTHFISTAGAEWSEQWTDPPTTILDSLAQDGQIYRPVSEASGQGWGFPTDAETNETAAVVSVQFVKWTGPDRCVLLYEYYLGMMASCGGSVELKRHGTQWKYLGHRSSYIS